MSTSPGTQRPPSLQPSGPSRRSIHALLTVLVAFVTVYLISNHWLHVLDALPYVWVVLMMSMHLFMHGGHGHAGHGGAGHGAGRAESGGGAGHVH